jgi:hypothetical protein
MDAANRLHPSYAAGQAPPQGGQNGPGAPAQAPPVIAPMPVGPAVAQQQMPPPQAPVLAAPPQLNGMNHPRAARRANPAHGEFTFRAHPERNESEECDVGVAVLLVFLGFLAFSRDPPSYFKIIW